MTICGTELPDRAGLRVQSSIVTVPRISPEAIASDAGPVNPGPARPVLPSQSQVRRGRVPPSRATSGSSGKAVSRVRVAGRFLGFEPSQWQGGFLGSSGRAVSAALLFSQANNSMGYARILARAVSDPGPPCNQAAETLAVPPVRALPRPAAVLPDDEPLRSLPGPPCLGRGPFFRASVRPRADPWPARPRHSPVLGRRYLG